MYVTAALWSIIAGTTLRLAFWPRTCYEKPAHQGDRMLKYTSVATPNGVYPVVGAEVLLPTDGGTTCTLVVTSPYNDRRTIAEGPKEEMDDALGQIKRQLLSLNGGV